MSRYTTEQARHLYNMAFMLELSGRELLRDAEVVVRECNGIGADWMPEIMRQACTDLNPVMEVPAAIHDLRYSRGTTTGDRKFADDEFLENCIAVTEHEYKWWNPLRYVFLWRAKRYHGYLRAFGGLAFGAKKETK